MCVRVCERGGKKYQRSHPTSVIGDDEDDDDYGNAQMDEFGVLYFLLFLLIPLGRISRERERECKLASAFRAPPPLSPPPLQVLHFDYGL